MRVGFLFNHDQLHQIAHSLPIALALARDRPDLQIVLMTTKPALDSEIRRLAGNRLGSNVELRRLMLSRWSSKAIAAIAGSFAPAAKLLIYGDNLDVFRSLDMLVVSEKTSLVLKTRFALPLKLIHTRHGAGDRAIGFEPASRDFDHILVAGRKIRDRLIAESGVDPARISIVGYPKFDLHEAGTADRDGADGDPRPIVLYNPHPSPHLSSWFRMGRKVLDWFVDHPEYRLIFAPHVMLFQRRLVVTLDRLRIARPGRLARRYRDAPNIQIDLGSRASTTMAYTDLADIYLGDVSSQIYEFWRISRPAIFLNAHDTPWQGDRNYAHWTGGEVIQSVDQLGPALARAKVRHLDHYGSVQRELFGATFDLTQVPSSDRAARVIAQLIGAVGAEPSQARVGNA